jgi:hypothetical protein
VKWTPEYLYVLVDPVEEKLDLGKHSRKSSLATPETQADEANDLNAALGVRNDEGAPGIALKKKWGQVFCSSRH